MGGGSVRGNLVVTAVEATSLVHTDLLPFLQLCALNVQEWRGGWCQAIWWIITALEATSLLRTKLSIPATLRSECTEMGKELVRGSPAVTALEATSLPSTDARPSSRSARPVRPGRLAPGPARPPGLDFGYGLVQRGLPGLSRDYPCARLGSCQQNVPQTFQEKVNDEAYVYYVVYMFINVIYVFTYIQREREIYIYIHIHPHTNVHANTPIQEVVNGFGRHTIAELDKCNEHLQVVFLF
jgi:hypothetical protein